MTKIEETIAEAKSNLDSLIPPLPAATKVDVQPHFKVTVPVHIFHPEREWALMDTVASAGFITGLIFVGFYLHSLFI